MSAQAAKKPEKEPLVQKSVMDELPPLTTQPLVSSSDRLSALHLITDSIAQQRQTASQSIILSPFFISAWVLMLALLTSYKYHAPSDLGIIATTGSGITMALLLLVRWSCEGYVSHAEEAAKMGAEWFDVQAQEKEGEAKGEVVVLGTKYGEELIGACVLRLPSPVALPTNSQFYDALPKVEILAWTVKLRFRHKGIGRGLLEEAVKCAREMCGKDVVVEFGKGHANSKMVLYGPFRGVFERREKKARMMLQEVVAEVRAEDVADLVV